ncbi:MAG TPA: hypothetical protein VHX86_15445 [Tepidisphaeraceae bacterium]|nr:hypothetical protein [Tepidisphaeraceae bacterium]
MQIVSRGDVVDPSIATQRPAAFGRGLDRFQFSFALWAIDQVDPIPGELKVP